MAVAPDLLLSSAAEVRSKAAPKPAAAPAEPVAGRPSSFARILADERQGSLQSSRSGESKGADAAAGAAADSQNTDASTNSGQVPVADSGNLLPAMADAGEGADPLALLGLNIDADAEGASGDGDQSLLEGDLQASTEADSELSDTAAVAPGLPVVSGTVVVDPEVEKLNSAAAVQVSLEMARKSETEKLAGIAAVGTAAAGAPGKGEAVLKTLGELNPEAQLEMQAEEADVELEPSKLLEALKGAAGGDADESQGARLNPLVQAINQASQAAQVQRTQVPGQPLAMHQPGWSEAVVDRVMWLSSQNLRSAEIQLDPAELGRLDVRVSLHQDHAQVSFSSPHAGVREALEAQMHRMRELFAQQGINQLDVNVSDQSMARNSQGRDDAEQSARGNAAATGQKQAEGEDLAVGETRVSQPATLRGLVDFYA